MDYSIGSLADLITGSNTPNKPKVIQKKFVKSVNSTDFPKIVTSPKNVNNENIKSKSLKKKAKHRNKTEKLQITNYDTALVETVSEKMPQSNRKQISQEIKKADTEGIKPKKTKKRKLDDSSLSNLDSGSEPSIKKVKQSKNDQNAERRVNSKDKKKKGHMDITELERTVYVGNVPIKIDKKKVKRFFKKYGKIESIRIRGISVANPNTSKKVAAIKKEFNPNRNNVFCYIRFANKEDALKAQDENGAVFEEHHLRVHICDSKERPDETKAIFVGNLSFDAEEDQLWKLFETCGPISHVRIIRDSKSGMGKGFAYVNFKDSDAVQLALEMENVKLGDRELRIALSNLKVARKKSNYKNKKTSQPRKSKDRKNSENNAHERTGNTIKKTNISFQGTKFGDKKKKRKVNKGVLQKKMMVKKIAPEHENKA